MPQKKTELKKEVSPEAPQAMSVRRKRLWSFTKLFLIPAAIYFLFFSIYTWPWMSHFNGWYFTDDGDGLQNVWNMWWINEAVTQLQTSPWYTSFLHQPGGTTLIGQTLNPFNGFVGILLLPFLSLNQAFNIMIIFSFIMSGVTMFWLCRYLTGRYVASIIGGFIFTFSSYHMAHGVGHMQLISMEWIPLFILLWWKLLVTPRYRYALGAALSLLLILFCDYYYFLYSVMLAVLILIYLFFRKQLPSIKSRVVQLRWGAFLLSSAILCLPLPLALLSFNSRDELLGSHPARIFSTDILTPFINGGFWRFSSLTDGYWKQIPGFTSETSNYIGVSVLILCVIVLIKRSKIHTHSLFWLGVAVFFAVLSLGPRLMYRGYTHEDIPLPYVAMERIIPGMKLSGMPVRMMFVTIFATSIIAAMVLAKVNLTKTRGKLIILAFSGIIFIELFPHELPYTPNTNPSYAAGLKALPPGDVLDSAAKGESYRLLAQTEYEKPMALGYVSRLPTSITESEGYLVEDVTLGRYEKVCSVYGIRYITTPISRPLNTTLPIVYKDSESLIYDLKNSDNC